MSRATAPARTVPPGRPESLFGLTPIRIAPDGTVTGSMDVDAGCADPGGPEPVAPLSGAIGVLADSVLGYSLNNTSDGWFVTTDIALEFLAPRLAGTVHTHARSAHADGTDGMARGEITDGSGTVLAYGTFRGRKTGCVPSAAEQSPPNVQARPGASPVGALAKAMRPAPEGGATFLADPMFGNPLGNLHGGITVCLADLVACRAMPIPSFTESIRVHFVRPVVSGSLLTLRPEVEHLGRTFGIVRVRGFDERGKLCTSATVVRSVMSGRM
ncbi:hotdog fold thioesterase [Nakamurella sp. YIM 132087]|uniref:Hotdog fold thioesterase n=1 Tax=Nakamurella alba TaxID=2665158 RepID=A0A7K1FI27_9ACTN|nr:hotdog fold thioesterase [Nakamurella alba]MTD12534.1 hotdog fold thioesterase [Nakamurella alba]